MITASIWLAAIAVYGLYCQNPIEIKDYRKPLTDGEWWRLRAVVMGVVSIFIAAILLTIAVNQ